jgi:hypothetical protein
VVQRRAAALVGPLGWFFIFFVFKKNFAES